MIIPSSLIIALYFLVQGWGTVITIPLRGYSIVLAGQGSGRLKTGRYLRYAENQELGSLHLSLLRLFGVDVTRFGESQMPLPGLDGSPFEAYQEKFLGKLDTVSG